MAIERFWERQGPVAFTADGGQDGLVTVDDVICFKVKQKVVIFSATQPNLQLEVKRVHSPTTLTVGPIRDKTKPARPKHNLKSKEDISAYTVADGAGIRAAEQPKAVPSPEDIVKAVYEQEPTLALRNILVDKYGRVHTDENPLWTGITDGQDKLEINNDGSINVNVVTSVVGTPVIFLDPNGEITDTTETEVATFTSTVDNTRIFKFLGEAHTFGVWRIYRDTVNVLNKVAVIRTSPFERTAKYTFDQPEVRDNTESLIVTFQAERYRDNLLGATSDTFVRLEGTS